METNKMTITVEFNNRKIVIEEFEERDIEGMAITIKSMLSAISWTNRQIGDIVETLQEMIHEESVNR